MKSLWNSFKAAFAMFSKIPVPQVDWTRENMKYMFCFFPLIGTAVGALTLLAAWAGVRLEFQRGFVAAVLTAIPVLVTGGIHLDGLLDTADALSSWQERKKRLEILKDSNAGAFAVITAGTFFVLYYGAWTQLLYDWKSLGVLSLGFMVSRSFSGIGVVSIPKAREDGTVAEFSRNASQTVVRNVLILYLVLLLAGMVWISPPRGIAAFIAALLVFVYYRHMTMKYFGGTTGDLSGFFLCLCELVMALTLSVCTAVI
ncbi:MAG: adenosylcobinamide-GDP ribazoletransferase [Clostridiales bacterium]|nr:adenosylcobinamide-GDP ribazoletransferase [Clostridiales bacterium]